MRNDGDVGKPRSSVVFVVVSSCYVCKRKEERDSRGFSWPPTDSVKGEMAPSIGQPGMQTYFFIYIYNIFSNKFF